MHTFPSMVSLSDSVSEKLETQNASLLRACCCEVSAWAKIQAESSSPCCGWAAWPHSRRPGVTVTGYLPLCSFMECSHSQMTVRIRPRPHEAPTSLLLGGVVRSYLNISGSWSLEASFSPGSCALSHSCLHLPLVSTPESKNITSVVLQTNGQLSPASQTHLARVSSTHPRLAFVEN